MSLNFLFFSRYLEVSLKMSHFVVHLAAYLVSRYSPRLVLACFGGTVAKIADLAALKVVGGSFIPVGSRKKPLVVVIA